MIQALNEQTLPHGWTSGKLDDVILKLQSGGTPRTTMKEYYEGGTIPFVKIEDMVNSNKYLCETLTKITEKGLAASSAWLVPENSLLYSMYASYGVPIINRVKVATNQAIAAILLPDSMFLDYVYYYLVYVKPHLKSFIRGTTQENLNSAIVSKLPIQIPPFNEQRRIVSRIEDLFTRLAAGVESLKKAKLQLKRCRQSVLKAAFEGKLSREWRKKHEDEIEPATTLLNRLKVMSKEHSMLAQNYESPPGKAGSFDLPDHWNWTTISSLLSEARYGTSVKCGTSVVGVPVLRIPNISRGNIDLSDLKFGKLADNELAKLSLANGDLLVIRTNGSQDLVGRSAIVKNIDRKFAFASYLIRLRPAISKILPEYINYYFQTEISRAFLKSKARTTAGQFNVNLAALRSVPLPLAPLQEQVVIIQKIEEMESVVHQIQSTVGKVLIEGQNLRQSILNRAFQGKLTSQDLNDEPAQKLLERIRESKSMLILSSSSVRQRHLGSM